MLNNEPLNTVDEKGRWTSKIARLILLMYLRDYKEEIRRLTLRGYLKKVLHYWKLSRRIPS